MAAVVCSSLIEAPQKIVQGKTTTMNPVRSINARELKRSIDARGSLLIDVQLPEYFETAHLPGARNACVYQVIFVDEVNKFAPDKAASLIVYGSSRKSLASAVAADKLALAGYRDLLDFRGGIEEWRKGGFIVEGTSQPPSQPALANQAYRIDPARSTIEWVGRNLASTHRGTLRVASGELVARRGRVAGGRFVIDMASIANADIEDKSYAQLLVDHLLSIDFFDVKNHPTAEFEITGIRLVPRATPGT